MDDAGDGGRWLTYAQLAEMRGITRKAAIRMTQRHRWRRQPGNDGTALVWVPHDDLTPRQLPSRQTARQTPDDDGGGDTPGISAALEAAVARADAADKRADVALAAVDSLREAHTGEVAALCAERDRLAMLIDGATARADRAEARTDALRDRIEAVREELAAAQAAAEEARRQAEELRQANAARRARGLVARLRAAWRGE